MLTAVKDSLATYISEKLSIKVLFFVHGLYLITIGYPLLLYIIPRPTVPDPLIALLNITLSLALTGGNFIQLLLIAMIGAKDQMILHIRNPLDSTILTFREKSQFVRSNAKKAFIMSLIILYLPYFLHYFIGIGDYSRFFMNEVILQYVLDRFSFLTFEKHAIQFRAATAKIILRCSSIKRFVEEYSPKTFVQAANQNEGAEELTHEKFLQEVQEIIESRVEILEHNLQTIKEDNSTPMLEVTGEVHILSKLFLLVSGMVCVSLALLSLATVYGTADNRQWAYLFFLFWHGYISPIISVVLFCSPVMLGFKEQGEDRNAEEQSQDRSNTNVFELF